jgi:hypothetical protein
MYAHFNTHHYSRNQHSAFLTKISRMVLLIVYVNWGDRINHYKCGKPSVIHHPQSFGWHWVHPYDWDGFPALMVDVVLGNLPAIKKDFINQ